MKLRFLPWRQRARSPPGRRRLGRVPPTMRPAPCSGKTSARSGRMHGAVRAPTACGGQWRGLGPRWLMVRLVDAHRRGGSPELNVPWNWSRWGRPSTPQVGAVVVWRHHVGEITGRAANGRGSSARATTVAACASRIGLKRGVPKCMSRRSASASATPARRGETNDRPNTSPWRLPGSSLRARRRGRLGLHRGPHRMTASRPRCEVQRTIRQARPTRTGRQNSASGRRFRGEPRSGDGRHLSLPKCWSRSAVRVSPGPSNLSPTLGEQSGSN